MKRNILQRKYWVNRIEFWYEDKMILSQEGNVIIPHGRVYVNGKQYRIEDIWYRCSRDCMIVEVYLV